VDKHPRKHGGDAGRGLAAVGPAGAVGSVREALRRLADPDLDASLAQVGAAPAAGGPDGVAGTTVDHVADDDAPLCSPVRYRVLRPHAKGGLGEVFVAEDTELHREVACKEIQRPHAHDAHSRGRFLLEAEVNGRLERNELLLHQQRAVLRLQHRRDQRGAAQAVRRGGSDPVSLEEPGPAAGQQPAVPEQHRLADR
jgi:hypothetical protein